MLVTTKEIEKSLPELAKVYIEAFKGEPWYEVSQCIDRQTPQRCPGGFSPIEIGNICTTCDTCPVNEAYKVDELAEKWQSIGKEKDAIWWIERVGDSIAMAALAWVGTSKQIAQEKYEDNPTMKDWIDTFFEGETQVIWLDEVFADKRVRSSDNLHNFEGMIRSMQSALLPSGLVSYRTITPQMTTKPKSVFADQAIVEQREIGVPDRRDFVSINVRRQQ